MKLLIFVLFIPIAYANLPEPGVKDGKVYPAEPVDARSSYDTESVQRKARGVADDGISGTCEFQYATCTGATVSLYDSKNEMIDQQMINLEGNFGFQNLKKKSLYRVVVNYPRHRAEGEKDRVQPGHVIHIQLQSSERL